MKRKSLSLLGAALIIGGGVALYKLVQNENKEVNPIIFKTTQSEYNMDDILGYTIQTTNEDEYYFGSDFIIQKNVDQEWTTYNDTIPSTMELNYIFKDIPYSYQREIPIHDLISEPGEYRLFKTIQNKSTETSLEISAEFIVK